MKIHDRVILKVRLESEQTRALSIKAFPKGTEGVIVQLDDIAGIAKVYFKSKGIISVYMTDLDLINKLNDNLPNSLLDNHEKIKQASR